MLGPLPRELAAGEDILAWAHASVPEVRAPAVLVVTDQRCLLHVASSHVGDVSTPLSSLSGFRLDRRDPEVVRVRLCGNGGDEAVTVELSLSNRTRSRSVGRVLSALVRQRVAPPESFDPALTSPLPPIDRGMRHHARRVWITVVGVLVLLVSALFASPFLPGPGSLTAVAGIAILAREYEWARDLHVWAARLVERFLVWVRRLRGRRRAAASRARGYGTGRVLEATVPVPGTEDGDAGRDGRALAS